MIVFACPTSRHKRDPMGIPRSRRSGAGRRLVRRIGHRRVKVRWVTPLGDETASRL